MTTDIEGRCVAGPTYSVIKGGAIRHQCGGGEDTPPMPIHDSLVDIWCEAEVVGIHDQTAAFQNRTTRKLRNFLGFARMSLASDWNSRVRPVRES